MGEREGGGLTCRGEQTGREQPVNAVRKQTRAVLHGHAERTLGRTPGPRTAQKNTDNRGLMTSDTFASNSYKAIQTKEQLLIYMI